MCACGQRLFACLVRLDLNNTVIWNIFHKLTYKRLYSIVLAAECRICTLPALCTLQVVESCEQRESERGNILAARSCPQFAVTLPSCPILWVPVSVIPHLETL